MSDTACCFLNDRVNALREAMPQITLLLNSIAYRDVKEGKWRFCSWKKNKISNDFDTRAKQHSCHIHTKYELILQRFSILYCKIYIYTLLFFLSPKTKPWCDFRHSTDRKSVMPLHKWDGKLCDTGDCLSICSCVDGVLLINLTCLEYI